MPEKASLLLSPLSDRRASVLASEPDSRTHGGSVAFPASTNFLASETTDFSHASASALDSRLTGALTDVVDSLERCGVASSVGVFLADQTGANFCRVAGSTTLPESLPIGTGSNEDAALAIVVGLKSLVAEAVHDAWSVHPFGENEAILGVLVAGNVRHSASSDTLMRLAVEQSALLVRNHRLHLELSESRRERLRLERQQQRLHQVIHAALESKTVDECYTRITSLAPEGLGTDFCSIMLSTKNPDLLTVVASTNPSVIPLIGQTINFSGMHVRVALERRSPVTSDDLSADLGVIPEVRLTARNMSTVFLPMFSDNGQPLGVITLTRHVLGPVPTEFIRICAGFALQAARAIEFTRMHEKAVRNAESRALLLRELNHRVKNSMAGIVALLSTDVPELPKDGKQWLHRIVQRIHVMARGHSLFDGYNSAVPLRALIDSAVESVEPYRLGKSTVSVDVSASAASTPMQSDQGVALAMVLHELCTNALHYGPAEGVDVRVKAWQADDRSVCIDVANNISPHSNKGGRSWKSTRLGLVLVRALVARELRGSFTTHIRNDGYNVATVVFKHFLANGV